ncbi:hypothetical protein A2U01_0081607, partial [Trifolium medium]|nr:hypothetical protein [Trifolium medium]
RLRIQISDSDFRFRLQTSDFRDVSESFREFQSFRVSEFRVSEFQSFRVSEFQSFRVLEFQIVSIPSPDADIQT